MTADTWAFRVFYGDGPSRQQTITVTWSAEHEDAYKKLGKPRVSRILKFKRDAQAIGRVGVLAFWGAMVCALLWMNDKVYPLWPLGLSFVAYWMSVIPKRKKLELYKNEEKTRSLMAILWLRRSFTHD